MEGDAGTIEALAETTVFLSYFKDMPDHRQAGKVTYPLDEILLLCLLAVLAGPFWRKEARPPAPVPPLPRGHARA
jgi:DDE_Tnp_1-associated